MTAIDDWDAWIGSCLTAHLKLAARIGHTDRWQREMTRRETRMDMGPFDQANELKAGLCRYDTPDHPCQASRTDRGCAFFHVHWHPRAEKVQHPPGTIWDETQVRFFYEAEEGIENENWDDGGDDGDEDEDQPWP